MSYAAPYTSISFHSGEIAISAAPRRLHFATPEAIIVAHSTSETGPAVTFIDPGGRFQVAIPLRSAPFGRRLAHHECVGWGKFHDQDLLLLVVWVGNYVRLGCSVEVPAPRSPCALYSKLARLEPPRIPDPCHFCISGRRRWSGTALAC